MCGRVRLSRRSAAPLARLGARTHPQGNDGRFRRHGARAGDGCGGGAGAAFSVAGFVGWAKARSAEPTTSAGLALRWARRTCVRLCPPTAAPGLAATVVTRDGAIIAMAKRGM